MSYWNAKKPLGIFPRRDYVPPKKSVQGLLDPLMEAGRAQKWRAHRLNGSKTLVYSSAIALPLSTAT
jgi:hypothetical protein